MIYWIILSFAVIATPRITLGFELEENADCAGVVYWLRYEGTKLLGGLVTSRNVETVDECKTLCITAADCLSFNLIGENAPFNCEMHTVKEGSIGSSMRVSLDSIYYHQKELCPEEIVTNDTTTSHSSDMNDDELQDIQDSDEDDDGRNHFERWVDDKPEAVAMVGMTILVILLVIVIIVIICVAYPRKQEEWDLKSSHV